MPLIAGIDIGNATTEVALASDDPKWRWRSLAGLSPAGLSLRPV